MTNNQDITTKGKSMLQYAMHYGLFLGLFWIIQYSLKIAGEAGLSDRFKYLFYLLNVGTFLLIYFFTLRYKESEPDKKISFLRCVGFVITLCFFASFFEGAAIYIHYNYIDPAFFDRMAEQYTHLAGSIYDSLGLQNAEELKEAARSIYSNKLFYVFGSFIGNTFLGAILGVLMGLLVNIKK